MGENVVIQVLDQQRSATQGQNDLTTLSVGSLSPQLRTLQPVILV